MVGDFATLCSGKHGIVSPHDGPVPSRRVPARPATRVPGELKSIGEEPELVGELSCLVPRNGDSSHVAGGECPASEDLPSVLWSMESVSGEHESDGALTGLS